MNLWTKRLSSRSSTIRDKDRTSCKDAETVVLPEHKLTSSSALMRSAAVGTEDNTVQSFEASETSGIVNETFGNQESDMEHSNENREDMCSVTKLEKQTYNLHQENSNDYCSSSTLRDDQSVDDIITPIPTECVYAQPTKNEANNNVVLGDHRKKRTTENEEVRNRLSYGEGYATIRESVKSGNQDSTAVLDKITPGSTTSRYEDVKLNEATLSSSVYSASQPPPLPSDTLTRPQRNPSAEVIVSISADPAYTEVSVLGTPMPAPPSKQDSVLTTPTMTSKSFSGGKSVSPYSQTQLAMRSQSERGPHHYRDHSDEEPMVELGSPGGLQKPSIHIPGGYSPAFIVNIPDVDDPDYEDLTSLQKTPTKPSSLLTQEKDEDNVDEEESGWEDNIIYDTMNTTDNDPQDEDEETSPELVTYEQPNRLTVKQKTDSVLEQEEETDCEEIRKSRLPNQEIQSRRQDEETSPQLVTYEQPYRLTVKHNTDGVLEDEADCEEIRKSRLQDLSETQIRKHEEETSPQLVTYEQPIRFLTVKHNTDSVLEQEEREADYEEIRKSRLQDLEIKTSLGPRGEFTIADSESLPVPTSSVKFQNQDLKKPTIRVQMSVADGSLGGKTCDPDYEEVLNLVKAGDKDDKDGGELEDDQCGWEDNIIYSSIDNDADCVAHTKACSSSNKPQLVTSQRGLLLTLNNQNDDNVRNGEEHDYEEIRRSRMLMNDDDAEYDSGRPVLTTEL